MIHHARHDEDAFTMVELMVGLVLSAIVLALVVAIVVKVFDSGDRVGARTAAQRATVLAAEQLATDTRAMRAPQRAPVDIGSPDQFRSILLTGNNPQNLQVHDLLVATANRITFYAEVDPAAAGTECVTWEVVASGALHRTVRAASPNCAGGAIRSQRELLPAPPASGTSAAAAAPAPFSFHRLAQPNPLAANINPDLCTTPVSTNLNSTLQRDQVTAISMDLRSFVVRRNGHGDQQLKTTASIAARQGIDYRYAIGCAA